MNTGLKTTRVECVCGGERLDVFLAHSLSGLTRSAAQRLLETGRVRLADNKGEGAGSGGRGSGIVNCEEPGDVGQGSGVTDCVEPGDMGQGSEVTGCVAPGDAGVVVRKSHRTADGEVFFVTQDEPESSTVAPLDIQLDIVYEDADVVVVNKPRGMVVHPAPGHPDGTLVNALLYHCEGSLSGIGGVKRPGIVHRIDKDTSGLVIAAKNDSAHLSLARQLSARTLTREYETIVRGAVKADSGTIEAPIGRHPSDRKRQAVTDKNSRPAVTHYEVIARYGGYTHLRCRLETGRTHQIRVHMAFIGHPVLGDMVYGLKKPELGLTGQCLHARKLKFIHPATDEPLELSAALPEYFAAVLAKLETR